MILVAITLVEISAVEFVSKLMNNKRISCC